MMVVFALALTLWATAWGRDPAPSLFDRVERSRNLVCRTVNPERAARAFPGWLRQPTQREIRERRVVVCEQRPLRRGLRPAREDAILLGLSGQANAMATSAAALRPDLAEHTWLVETFDPSSALAGKVAFATKLALAEQGLQVSDRVPILGAGDLEVITQLPPDRAYPAACARYEATGQLREQDALLAVVTRDLRATVLNAGLCVGGRWTWVR